MRANGDQTRRQYRDAKDGPGYDAFRTGLSFKAVRQMFWSGSPDSKDWRYKRRGTVLGAWRELKLQLYHQMMDQLEDQQEAAE